LSRMTSNFQEKVPIASTIEPPGGLWLVFDCYDILCICIVERWKALGIVLLWN
jgi:hypothetical protein